MNYNKNILVASYNSNYEYYKLTKNEYLLEDLLYELCYDKENNTINLKFLDFTKFKCNVDISGMSVNGNLTQSLQTASNNIYQHTQTFGKELFTQKFNADRMTKADYYSADVFTMKPLKKITKNELARLGYELVEN